MDIADSFCGHSGPRRSAKHGPAVLCDGLQEAELSQGLDPVIQADLFDDLRALKPQHRRSCETHLATRGCRQLANQEVAERRAGMRATAFPTSDHVVTFCDEVPNAP